MGPIAIGIAVRSSVLERRLAAKLARKFIELPQLLVQPGGLAEPRTKICDVLNRLRAQIRRPQCVRRGAKWLNIGAETADPVVVLLACGACAVGDFSRCFGLKKRSMVGLEDPGVVNHGTFHKRSSTRTTTNK